MAEAHKLCYIVVVDDHTRMGENESSAGPGASQSLYFRYTYAILQSTLQLMGCKPRLAFKISKKVFEIVKAKALVDLEREVNSLMDANKLLSNTQEDCIQCFCIGDDQAGKMVETVKASADKDKSLHLHKKRLLAVLRREIFLDIVCDALAQYRYVGPNQRTDLAIACRIRERNESITILLCGASGCGKSTLSSLLASRLGITTVVSTDSLRHMMRGFMNENDNPLLWASTYHAGECLDPIAVAEAKAKKKEKKITRLLANGEHSVNNIKGNVDRDTQPANNVTQEVVEAYKTQIYEKNVTDGNKVDVGVERVSSKTMAIEGYKAQSEMVIDNLDRLITIWEERKQSVVIEGVHLSLNFVMGLMRKHPSIIPFTIYIANEEKHLERFAVRAKYMTLDPAKNRYVKYIRNIRTIQEYLCKRAEKHLVPKINNTNVDKSVGSIHATIFSCLRRRYGGEQLYDQATNTVKLVDEEYRNCCAGNSLSSKGMFKLIQRQGSSRQLMALVNTDGSVAKAWPIEVACKSGKANTSSRSNSNIGSPMYGPLQVGKEEPVNLQFGKFGISSWPDDAVGTSHANGFDEDEQPNHYSSMSNSPRNSDGPAKEPIGGSPVSVSEEEEDAEVTQLDDEDDLSDSHVRAEEELGGSVDEGSARSDEGSEEVFSYDDEGDDWPGKSEVIDIEGKPTTVNTHAKEIEANAVQNTASLIRKHSVSKHVHDKLPLSPEENRKHLHRHTQRSKSGNSRRHKLTNRTQSLPSFEEHSLSDHADRE